MAEKYSRAIETSIRMHTEGKSAAEIDKVVKIDDGPAFAGFKTLTDEVDKIRESCSTSILRTVKNMRGLVLVTGGALFLFFSLFL